MASFKRGDNDETEGLEYSEKIDLPDGVAIFEISGPLFFGAAYKFQDAIRMTESRPKVLTIRMRNAPVIDATGIRVLKEVFSQSKRRDTKLILSEISNAQIIKDLADSRLLFAIGKANVTDTLPRAVERSTAILC
ncbi:MAG TPA: sodium-independent anion transporter [Puia sp.]|jgi:SulP family sulfate permease|nr:sodium-independent anion transporter [Puia sp.]